MVKKISDIKGLISMVECENINQYKILIRLLNLYGWKPSNTFVDDFKKYPVIYIHKDVGYTALQKSIPVAGYTAISYSDFMKAYSEDRKDIRLATIKDKLTLLVIPKGDEDTYNKCINILSLNGLEEGYISQYSEVTNHILIKNGRYSSVSGSVLDREPIASPDMVNGQDFLKINN